MDTLEMEEAQHNVGLLEYLATILEGYRPWLVAGDWNISSDLLFNT